MFYAAISPAGFQIAAHAAQKFDANVAVTKHRGTDVLTLVRTSKTPRRYWRRAPDIANCSVHAVRVGDCFRDMLAAHYPLHRFDGILARYKIFTQRDYQLDGQQLAAFLKDLKQSEREFHKIRQQQLHCLDFTRWTSTAPRDRNPLLDRMQKLVLPDLLRGFELYGMKPEIRDCSFYSRLLLSHEDLEALSQRAIKIYNTMTTQGQVFLTEAEFKSFLRGHLLWTLTLHLTLYPDTLFTSPPSLVEQSKSQQEEFRQPSLDELSPQHPSWQALLGEDFDPREHHFYKGDTLDLMLACRPLSLAVRAHIMQRLIKPDDNLFDVFCQQGGCELTHLSEQEQTKITRQMLTYLLQDTSQDLNSSTLCSALVMIASRCYGSYRMALSNPESPEVGDIYIAAELDPSQGRADYDRMQAQLLVLDNLFLLYNDRQMTGDELRDLAILLLGYMHPEGRNLVRFLKSFELDFLPVETNRKFLIAAIGRMIINEAHLLSPNLHHDLVVRIQKCIIKAPKAPASKSRQPPASLEDHKQPHVQPRARQLPDDFDRHSD